MIRSPRIGPRKRPDLPFRYVAGDPALDLVNTVDWTRRGPDDERLTDYARFTEFAVGAGLIDAVQGNRLRKLAAREPYAAAEVLRRAHTVRDALQRLVVSAATAASRTGRDHARSLGALNDELRSALGHLALREAANGATLRWIGLGESLESPLWPLVWSAAQLLASEEQTRVRVCAAEDCGWVYVDRSRNRLRRWCQMETCGNRAKANRRYSRVRRNAGGAAP
jgi:predicted RNA-binding Zn ribbon-like protein